jgi:hypothetical protein
MSIEEQEIRNTGFPMTNEDFDTPSNDAAITAKAEHAEPSEVLNESPIATEPTAEAINAAARQFRDEVFKSIMSLFPRNHTPSKKTLVAESFLAGMRYGRQWEAKVQAELAAQNKPVEESLIIHPPSIVLPGGGILD